RAAVLVNKGSALLCATPRYDEAEPLLVEGAAAADAVGDHLSALRALYNLSNAAFVVWSIERSRALLDQMADIVERSGRRDWAGRVELKRAALKLHVEGDLETARDMVARVQPVGHDLWFAQLEQAVVAL